MMIILPENGRQFVHESVVMNMRGKHGKKLRNRSHRSGSTS